ncbi:MAG: PAP2 family protein, partial [Gammaproteobacteria bacterium]|nr:PAP2 family protein [Gammaproteobacteria bacterium]
GSPLVTDWIDYAYGPPWFWMMIGLKFWLSFTMHPQRLRFLLAFLLSWLLLGNVAGTLLASVGPVYYGTFV